MKISRVRTLCASTAALLAAVAPITAAEAAPKSGEIVSRSHPRLIVLTDIGAEVDDQESLIRLLLYANEIDIEGLVATTSTFLRDEVRPDLIEERVQAYAQVRSNLEAHAQGFPEAASLLTRIRSGRPAYGMSGVGPGKDTEGSRLLIEAADRADPRPVWISIWGGAADLAQALFTVRSTRSPQDVGRFVAKLRVYAISDQDDAGPWIRINFPKLFWVGSLKDVKEARSATWIGISAPLPGSDPDPVNRAWLETNIRNKGPLGALYPQPKFLMEGDTPAFLHLISNGLRSPDHPDWGSWGGRYWPQDNGSGAWAEAVDTVTGSNGALITSNQATVWRWRKAYQNDFAARMEWSVQPNFKGANHPPEVRLNSLSGNDSLEIAACPDRPVRLTAKGSVDPDGQPLTYRWWWYPEPSGEPAPSVTLSHTDGITTTVNIQPPSTPGEQAKTPRPIHVILEVTDTGAPALTRYRRAVISLAAAAASTIRDMPAVRAGSNASFRSE